MKTPAERGVLGAWAYDARTAVPLSVEQVVEKLAARGHRIHEATIRGIESGAKRPGRVLLRQLGELYESPPPGAQETIEPALELIAAIRAQTEAISALVEELRAERERGQDAAAAMLRAAEVLLSAQRQGAAEASTEPVVR